MSETLYEIGDALERAFAEIEAELAVTDGEYTPEMAARLDALELKWEEKIERVALRYRSQRAQVGAIVIEERRLERRRVALEKDADWLLSYLGQALNSRGLQRVERPLATVRIQDNPPSVVCSVPLSLVPAAWVREKPAEYSLDKSAVLAAAKRGEELPEGISVTRGKSVRVA